MAVVCSNVRPMKISFDGLSEYCFLCMDKHVENLKFGISRIESWYDNPGSNAIKALNGLKRASDGYQLFVIGRSDFDAAKILNGIAHLFLVQFASNTTRLDGSRVGPVWIMDNAFAISDCLAAGRFNNAAVLHEQALQLLGQRAYEIQALYAEELELAKDPANEVGIIPQRLFAFVHELMGKRAGEAAQPWGDWDIVPDPDYVTAARAVYTEDMEEAAETVCRLCNLHIEHSNPFAFDSDNDRLLGFEFDDPVRAIWPTEIFAWLSLRQERGLALPEVSHPLLDQPLGRFEPKLPRKIEHEDWFIELVHKLAAFHPRYADLPRMVFDDP